MSVQSRVGTAGPGAWEKRVGGKKSQRERREKERERVRKKEKEGERERNRERESKRERVSQPNSKANPKC